MGPAKPYPTGNIPTLPEEILDPIFSYLEPLPGSRAETNRLQRRTLAAILRANKACYRIAYPYVYRNLLLSELNGRYGLLLSTLLGKPKLAREVRHITTDGARIYIVPVSLQAFVQACPGLESFMIARTLDVALPWHFLDLGDLLIEQGAKLQTLMLDLKVGCLREDKIERIGSLATLHQLRKLVLSEAVLFDWWPAPLRPPRTPYELSDLSSIFPASLEELHIRDIINGNIQLAEVLVKLLVDPSFPSLRRASLTNRETWPNGFQWRPVDW